METTLFQWYSENHNTNEYQQLFYLMDSTMRYIHNSNFYISSFGGDRILIGRDQEDSPYVLYQDVKPIREDFNASEIIQQNKASFALLQVALYSDTIMYVRDSTQYNQFVKDNFDSFSVFLPEDDINYFRNMIVNQGHLYYSDYRRAKSDQEISKLNKSLEENNSGVARGRSLSKSTANGKIAAQLYNLSDDSNKAAFVQHYLLPFIILLLSMLIPILSWVFALS